MPGACTCSHSLRQQNVFMRAASTACGSTGASPWPQLPTAIVVIPCSTLDCARPSTSSVKSACEWMSTTPGATTRPLTSSTSAAGPRSLPTAAMWPCAIATSARRGGAPVPSTTVPPVSSRSVTRRSMPALTRGVASDRHSLYAGLSMDEHDKRRIGEQIEPGGRPKAPGRLELLQRFINSHNHDLPPEWDRIGTPQKARAWLREKRLVAPDDRISAADVARLIELREAIRALVVANQERRPAAADVIRRVSGAARLGVTVDDAGRTALEPADGGVDGAVATLLGILHEAQLTGHWSRMKGCRQCEYAFFDRSKNRSAAWCAMSICGNRTKNRSYYRRRRDASE